MNNNTLSPNPATPQDKTSQSGISAPRNEVAASPRGIVVISGGSAANSLVDVFNQITSKRQCPLSYIIPISDNGGSSSEVIRVFGGPGIGDIRSELRLSSLCFAYLLGSVIPFFASLWDLTLPFVLQCLLARI